MYSLVHDLRFHDTNVLCALDLVNTEAIDIEFTQNCNGSCVALKLFVLQQTVRRVPITIVQVIQNLRNQFVVLTHSHCFHHHTSWYIVIIENNGDQV